MKRLLYLIGPPPLLALAIVAMGLAIGVAAMYYRLMGMRIGREVTLNSTAIADPSLIELGDRATIGGSANILAHCAQGAAAIAVGVLF